MPPPDPPDDPPAVRWLGRCRACRRSVEADAADVRRYVDEGWPRCCGHDLTFELLRAPPDDPAPVA